MFAEIVVRGESDDSVPICKRDFSHAVSVHVECIEFRSAGSLILQRNLRRASADEIRHTACFVEMQVATVQRIGGGRHHIRCVDHQNPAAAKQAGIVQCSGEDVGECAVFPDGQQFAGLLRSFLDQSFTARRDDFQLFSGRNGSNLSGCGDNDAIFHETAFPQFCEWIVVSAGFQQFVIVERILAAFFRGDFDPDFPDCSEYCE